MLTFQKQCWCLSKLALKLQTGKVALAILFTKISISFKIYSSYILALIAPTINFADQEKILQEFLCLSNERLFVL